MLVSAEKLYPGDVTAEFKISKFKVLLSAHGVDDALLIHAAGKKLRDMNRFNALFEYLLCQSGGLLDVTKTASALGISRPTLESHLRSIQITHAVTLLRPFHGGGRKELVRMPKMYGFDTGLVSFIRCWDPLRAEDF